MSQTANKTAEQIVKEKRPQAYCRYLTAEQSFLGYQVVDPNQRIHNYYFAPISRLELTEQEAWADAAQRLGGRS